ncbi:MAG TPA: DUF4340 domain-containing protein [Bacteroidales bacterium]|nr:DUF4340 domain-containing protein [Bacteroidales bacterium]
MFSKLNVKVLAIIFGVLLVIVVVSQISKRAGDERNFKDRLVEVDTSKISSIVLTPKGQSETLTLKRSSSQWELAFRNKTYKTDEGSVGSLLSALMDLKPERIVADEKESWDRYDVSETKGTHIRIREDSKDVADLVIGKVSYQQNYQGVTVYVRLTGEDDVYAVSGYAALNLHQDLSSLRYKKLGRGAMNDITKVTFTYPDSSFTLARTDRGWNVNNVLADSTKVYNFLQTITSISGSTFADDATPVNQPVYTVAVSTKTTGLFEINAFPADSTNQFIVTSNVNPGARFKEARDGIINRMFVSKKYFEK